SFMNARTCLAIALAVFCTSATAPQGGGPAMPQGGGPAMPAESTTVATNALDLRGAIRYALEHSPSLAVARQTLDLREIDYKNTYATLFPSADATATGGLANTIPNP